MIFDRRQAGRAGRRGGRAGYVPAGSAPVVPTLYEVLAAQPGLFACFIADAANITITGSGVSQWNDLTANAYHVSQSTDGARPTLSAGAINGKDAVRFQNGNQYISRAATGSNRAQPNTYYLVAQATAGATATWVDGGGSGTRHQIQLNSTNVVRLASNTAVAGTTSVGGSWCAVRAVFSSPNSALYVNNFTTPDFSNGNSATHQMNGLNLGTNYAQNATFLSGYIRMLACYTGTHTQGQANAIRDAINLDSNLGVV